MARVRSKRRRRQLVDVVAHLPLVKRIAKRMARRLPRYVDTDDLISSGVMGLLDAAGRWDPKINDSFAAFAEFRIRGAMTDYLREGDTLSRDMRRIAKELVDVAHRLEGKLCRSPTHEEMAEALGLTVDQLYARKEKLTGSTVVGIDDAGPDLLERVADEDAVNPLEMAARLEEAACLVACIQRLPEKMQQVLSLYYVAERTFGEIGKAMGLTESRVCQIHTAAMPRLRACFARMAA